MGSRAIVVVCRDADVARERFGIDGGETGAIYTRTGRPFLDDAARHRGGAGPRPDGRRRRRPLGCSRDRLARARLRADAVVGEGDRPHPPPVRVRSAPRRRPALHASRRRARRGARRADATSLDVARTANVGASSTSTSYIDAYRRYVWPVNDVRDLRLAPFHVLAAETGVFVDRDHAWHLRAMRSTRRAPIPTGSRPPAGVVVDVTDSDEPGGRVGVVGGAHRERWRRDGRQADRLHRPGRKGLVQPGIKCRGREYLRIIYGPEYAEPGQIDRLRARGLGRKRSLAIREFGLGIEALERFVRREPLYRVHECVFGVLAMETEPVDPRL